MTRRPNMIFDTHAHYDDEMFDEDRETLLDSMEARGIGYIVNVGTNMESCRETLGMIKRFPFVYGALGFHPTELEDIKETDYEWLKKNIFTPKVVAVGEIGLDYYWQKNEETKQQQKDWFEKQLELARVSDLPVCVHSRDAAKDTLDIMKAVDAGSFGGVIHCFSYGVDMAREFLNMGLYLGIGGVATFKNSKLIKEVIAYAPIEQLVLETDCPYLTPEPYRGSRNSSLYLPYVVTAIAEIKEMDPNDIIEITRQNAKKLFDLN